VQVADLTDGASASMTEVLAPRGLDARALAWRILDLGRRSRPVLVVRRAVDRRALKPASVDVRAWPLATAKASRPSRAEARRRLAASNTRGLR
jgi:hypothetical protein